MKRLPIFCIRNGPQNAIQEAATARITLIYKGVIGVIKDIIKDLIIE